jgi:DNA-directed RNA polymerase subunit RPC12/RpoP
MDDINYRCPECGGKLLKAKLELGLKGAGTIAAEAAGMKRVRIDRL